MNPRDRLQLLLSVTNAVVSSLSLRELLKSITACLRNLLPHEYTTFGLYDASTNILRVHALDFPEGKGYIREEFAAPLEDFPAARAIKNRKAEVLNREDLKSINSDFVKLLLAENIQTVCCVPLISHNVVLGSLNAASIRENAFNAEDINLLNEIAAPISLAVENALSYQKIEELKNKLADEKLYLEEEIRTQYDFHEIIGQTAALKQVLKQVETVAPSDAIVLILGETGTGKELIARAIHDLSNRRQRTFVKLNAAAIPTGLLESELFGHERGAFTGAISQRVGRLGTSRGYSAAGSLLHSEIRAQDGEKHRADQTGRSQCDEELALARQYS